MTRTSRRVARRQTGRPRAARRSALPSLLVALTLLLPTATSAAELRGRIWDASTKAAPPGVKLQLACGKNKFPAKLTGNGAYSIRNVPSGASCRLTVTTSSGSASRSITVNGPVVRFNGETRVVGKGIVLIPR